MLATLRWSQIIAREVKLNQQLKRSSLILTNSLITKKHFSSSPMNSINYKPMTNLKKINILGDLKHLPSAPAHSDPTRGFWGGGIFFGLFLVRMHVPRVHMIFSSDFMLRTQILKFWVILSIFEHFQAKILHFQKILAIFRKPPPASILTF